jgi:hypothetical protein
MNKNTGGIISKKARISPRLLQFDILELKLLNLHIIKIDKFNLTVIRK